MIDERNPQWKGLLIRLIQVLCLLTIIRVALCSDFGVTEACMPRIRCEGRTNWDAK